jgi:hypothetical protein
MRPAGVVVGGELVGGKKWRSKKVEDGDSYKITSTWILSKTPRQATTQGPQHQEKTHASSSPDWLAGVDVWNLGLKLLCISDVPFLTQMWLIGMTGCWQWQLTALGNGVCS